MKALIFILLCLSLDIFCADKYENGEIRFPANKLFNQDAGTYEIWFKQELALDDQEYRLADKSNRSICHFFLVSKHGLKKTKNKNDDEFVFMNFGLFTDGQRFTLGAGFNHTHAGVGKVLKHLKLDMNKWHHAAISWEKTASDKYKLTTYCNGLVIRSSEQTYKNSDKVGRESTIFIGHAVKHHEKLDSGSLATIDSFKLSKRALTLDEISKSYQKGSFTSDKDTIIIEDFSKLKMPKKAKPGLLSETGKTSHKQTMRGTLYGNAHLVDGRNGTKAIKLFRKK